jgi:Rrf2 family protein
MLELALHHGEAPVLLKDVAQHQEISEKYLGQLVIPLTKKGLVLSSRGNPRGYTLVRNPELITMLEIVETLEGNISPVDCLSQPGSCGKSGACVTMKVWKKLDEAIRETLRSFTLQDLVDEFRKGQGTDSVYFI